MTIILKSNNPEVREKIRTSGIKLCKCTEFKDSVWLDYHPGCTDSVHGVGYYGDEMGTKSVQEELDRFVSECKYPIYCKDVDDFIAKIKTH